MFRVFNMGIGMVLVIDPQAAAEVMPALAAAGSVAAPLGTVQKGKGGVVYDFTQERQDG